MYEPCLLNAWTLSALASLQVLDKRVVLTMDCYNPPKDHQVDFSTLPTLHGLRVCAFDDLYRFQHQISDQEQSLNSLKWNGEALAEEICQTLKNNPKLRHLHIITHRSNERRAFNILEWDQAVCTFIQTCGRSISESEITSIALEGTFAQTGVWDGWESGFDRVRVFSCSHAHTLREITERFPDSFQYVTEMRLSILHHDFACGHTPGQWPRPSESWPPAHIENQPFMCSGNLDLHGSSFHALLRLLEGRKLHHLSLCGFDRAVLIRALESNGPTLKSLRFYVQRECCAADLSVNDLTLIQQSCPVLAWVGVTVELTDLLSSIQCAIPEYPTKFLDALSRFQAMESISLFVPGYNSKDWDLYTFELAQVFSHFQLRKRGKSLSSLRIDCNNHVWKLSALGPSKVLIKSFSRDKPEPGYLVEMWDLVEFTLESSETVSARVEPEYEWGLTKWELCDNKGEVYTANSLELPEMWRKHRERKVREQRNG
jgi:hypothetical protein